MTSTAIMKLVGLVGLAMLASVTASAETRSMTLAFVAADLKYPTNVATQKGFEDAAREAGIDTKVLDPKSDVSAQAAEIKALIKEKVAGIGMLPMDSVQAKTWADDAASAGIPMVSVAVQVGDPKTMKPNEVYPKLAAMIATDDVRAGYSSGELAITLMAGRQTPKIAIVEGAPGFSAVELRTRGFKQALDGAGIKYDIVASVPTDWTPQKGEEACRDILAKYPDVDLIFSQADDMALGCIKAKKSTLSNVKLIASGGGSAAGNRAIESGDLDGSVCTRPELMGRLMFKVLYDAATNPQAAKAQYHSYDMPIVTKDTLFKCPAEW